jgi:hypothetical protein
MTVTGTGGGDAWILIQALGRQWGFLRAGASIGRPDRCARQSQGLVRLALNPCGLSGIRWV